MIQITRPSRPSTQGSLLQLQKSQTQKRYSIDSQRDNYIVNVNLSSINSRNYQKDKIKQKYLDHFRNKLGLRSKSRVLPPSEDYLYRLTTKEIDNLVNMQRNRYLDTELQITNSRMSDRGQAEEKQSSHHLKKSEEKRHTRIYRPGFLCKLSKIVKKTDFFNKNDNLISYHFQKEKKNLRYAGQAMPQSQCIQHDDLQAFSVKGKSIKDIRERSKTKIINKKNMWFSGMSRSLIANVEEQEQPVFRGMNLEKRHDHGFRLKTTFY